MTWYAIRTEPGAQLPQREYAVEKTRSRKGYRIVPSLNPNLSAIERVLTDAGITYYMPVEKRLMRDRLKPYLWKQRRFALIVGYVFVRDPHWHKLVDMPGVAGVVGSFDKPLAIDFLDVLKLFDAERTTEIEFLAESKKARQHLRKLAKSQPELQKIVDQLDIAGTISVPLDKHLAAA